MNGIVERRIALLIAFTRTLRESLVKGGDGPLSAWRVAQIIGSDPIRASTPMRWLERHGVVERVLEAGQMRFTLCVGYESEHRVLSVLREHGGESLQQDVCGVAQPRARLNAMIVVDRLADPGMASRIRSYFDDAEDDSPDDDERPQPAQPQAGALPRAAARSARR
jgi:hypothetical protein